MSNILLVKIILPSKIALQIEADMVNIPGKEGVFGVLPGHAKITSSIDIGVVTLFTKDMEVKYFIYGGVVQVADNEVNVISDFAVDISSENSSSVSDNIKKLEKDLSEIESNSMEVSIISEKIKKYQSLLEFV